MIKLAKTGLLSVALLATVVANASKIGVVKSSKDKIVNISFTEITKEETISVIDIQGVKLYTEKLKNKNSYIKKFDFSSLPIGIYFFESRGAKEINVTPIIIKKDIATVLSEDTKTYNAPEIKLDTDTSIASVMVKNFDSSTVVITIYDAYGNELENSIYKNLLVYKAYNFSKSKKETYTISVTQAGYTFNKSIDL